MKQEQNQVLSMLESGKITPEQADELLEALQPRTEVLASVDLPSQSSEQQANRTARATSSKKRSRKRGGFSTKEIVEMGIHDVNPQFVHDMQKLFGDLRFTQIMQLAIHDIKPSFVEEIRALNLEQLDFNTIVEMGIHGVDTQFVKDLAQQGLEDLSAREIIEFAIHGINADFVKTVQGLEDEFSDIAARDASTDVEDPDEANDLG